MKYSFVILFILPFALKAQRVLSLEEAIATALQNNYSILMTKNDSASLAIDKSYVNAAFLPRVNGTATKVWSVNAQKQELANGSKRDTSGLRSNNQTAAINLNWTLFDGLRMFITKDRILAQNEIGPLAVKNQVINTVATVVNSYYNIVRQKQQVKAIEYQITINQERVKLADKKLSVGLGAKPELLQAKVDLNAQEALRLNQLASIEQLRQQLNQLMSLPLKTLYDVSDTIPLNTSLQYGDLENGLATGNPSLQIAQKNIDIAKLSYRERKAELFPTLNFNSAYNISQLRNKAVINTFTPLFNQNKGFNYGFSLTVPILNGFNTKRLIKQAALDIQFQELSYKNQLSVIDLNLANVFEEYEQQKKALQLEEENILLARENMNIAIERFRQGVSTSLELREAQKSLEDAFNRLIAARYTVKLAETELLRLKGELVK